MTLLKKPKISNYIIYTYTIIILIFLSIPIFVSIAVGFGDDKVARFPPRSLSLEWVKLAIDNPTFINALFNSIVLAFLTTIATIIISLPATLALVKHKFPYQPTLEAYLLSPLSLPGVLYGMSMLFFLGEFGLGLPSWALLISHIVLALPYGLRTTLVIYRSSDRSLEDVGMVLGANHWQTFFYITLPMLKPGIVAGGLFAFLISFDNVPVSIFLTTSDNVTLPVAIMSYLVGQNFDASIGAISAIQVLVVLILLYILDRFYGINQLKSFGS